MGRGFQPQWGHCVVVLEQDIYPSLVLVQPRNRPCLTERLLMGHKESNQTNKTKAHCIGMAINPLVASADLLTLGPFFTSNY